MNILHFLTPKSEVAYLYDDFSLRQALEKMEYHQYSAIPVITREGEYVGVITEGDLLRILKIIIFKICGRRKNSRSVKSIAGPMQPLCVSTHRLKILWYRQ